MYSARNLQDTQEEKWKCMNVKNCYEIMNGDYEDVKRRFLTDARIRKAFREEMPDVTKIIIAQRISSVQDCDRIIVLDKGRIAESGTHDELIRKNGIYREIFESQTGKEAEA